MEKCKIYLLLISTLIVNCFAQQAVDSLAHSPNNFSQRKISTEFGKRLNIYDLRTQLSYHLSMSKFFVGFDEKFNSTIIKSGNQNIKDEHYFSMLSEYRVNPILSAGVMINNDIYKDNRSLAINQVSITRASIYSKFSPAEKIKIIPFGGISQNQQIGEKDNGYIYGAEVGIDSLLINDFMLNSSASFDNEDISPRRNLNRLVGISFSNQYENSLMNKLSASYGEHRRDFYINADSITSSLFQINNNIQSRTETAYFLEDELILLPQNSGISVSLFGRVDWREIDRSTRYVSLSNISTNSFDTNIEEYRFNFATNVRYVTGWMQTLLKINLAEREEKHKAKEIPGASSILYERRNDLEFQKNNKAQQTSLSLTSDVSLSVNDKLLFSLFHRKLEYDTPSEDNYDDRDELLTIFGIEYRRRINSLMDVFLKMDGSVSHVVYIFAERSSNNNIRRVLKLSSGTSFTGSKIRTQLTGAVMADYTVFDFQDLNPFLKNYSFRRFQVSDSSSFKINEKLSLTLNGYVMLSEQGDFNWNNFTNNPSRFLQEIYAEPMLRCKFQDVVFGLGVRYFSLCTYGYENGNRVKESEYKSFGPVTEINVSFADRLSLSVYGYYEFITNESNSKRELANMSLKLNWNL